MDVNYRNCILSRLVRCIITSMYLPSLAVFYNSRHILGSLYLLMFLVNI